MKKLTKPEKVLLATTDLEKFNSYYCDDHGLFLNRKDIDDSKCPYCKKLCAPIKDIYDLKVKFRNELGFNIGLDQLNSMIKIGTKIFFKDEKKSYKVKAYNDRYVICTKPFNAQKTVIYTIIDLVKNIRGTDNLVFGHGYESDKDCSDALNMLALGEMEVSHRRNVKLEITTIDNKQSKP